MVIFSFSRRSCSTMEGMAFSSWTRAARTARRRRPMSHRWKASSSLQQPVVLRPLQALHLRAQPRLHTLDPPVRLC